MSVPSAPASHESIRREYAEHYPPIISINQAAQIAQVSPDTIYDWSSRGYLDAFKHKRGAHVRLERDEFVAWFLES